MTEQPGLQSFENANRPWPIPARPWRLRQRWSQLLMAHWPVRPDVVQRRLPAGLTVDVHDGWAWLGVVPFLMDQVRFRTFGNLSAGVPTATAFPELNLRTYVIAPDGHAGVYFFSLDAASLLAVIGARVAFGLPYFWARMSMENRGSALRYTSRRLLGPKADFAATYRSLGTPSPRDSLGSFVTERYAFYLRRFGAVQAGEISHAPWNWENAEAEFEQDDLPASFGFTPPDRPPVLHYSAEIHMQAWTVQKIRGQGLTSAALALPTI